MWTKHREHFFHHDFPVIVLLQPRTYQVSKEVVHDLDFGDVAIMQI